MVNLVILYFLEERQGVALHQIKTNKVTNNIRKARKKRPKPIFSKKNNPMKRNGSRMNLSKKILDQMYPIKGGFTQYSETLQIKKIS